MQLRDWRWAWATGALLALLAAVALASRIAPVPSASARAETSERARVLVRDFLAAEEPSRTLDLDALYGDAGRRALLDPAEALPTWVRYPYSDAENLARYTRSCRPEDAPAPLAPDLAKAAQWQRAACGAVPPPSDAFFLLPPFMHPSGHSYVALASATRGAAWGRAHASLLHSTELDGIGTADPDLRLVGSLSRASLRALSRGDVIVLDDRAILLRAPRDVTDTRDVVKGFSRSTWERYRAHAGLVLAPRSIGAGCIDGATPDLCWTTPRSSTLRVAAFASLATLGLALLAGLAWQARADRLAEDDRALILRTLTHELRTPATSLALALEPLRRAYDELPAALQEPLLRVSEDAERIKRVIAVSARWLSLHHAKGAVALAIERLPAATPLIRSIVVAYGGDVDLVEAPVDHPLSTDPEWFRLAMRNLIDNALAHGKPPVRVVMRWQNGKLAVDVIDAGDTAGVTMGQLAREFRKGPRSSGLGLGLAIVSRVATALGGALEHHANPTTFRLVVGNLEGRT